jgi:hypothetical protein
MSGNDGLRPLAGDKIVPERYPFALSGCASDIELERRSGMPVPDFCCVDPMPVRVLAARQQKVNRRRGGASATDLPRIAECLAEMAAFRMRF